MGNTPKSIQNPNRGLATEANRDFSFGNQRWSRPGVQVKHQKQRYASRVDPVVGGGKRKMEGLSNRPVRKVRVPVRAESGPSLEDGLPSHRIVVDKAFAHSLCQKRHTTRFLIEDVEESVMPKGVVRKEVDNPLGLKSPALNSGRKVVDSTLKAGATTDQLRRHESGVVIPDRLPSQLIEPVKVLVRRKRKSEFVPQTSEEFRGGDKRAALEGEVARENVPRNRFKLGVKSVPILLHPFR